MKNKRIAQLALLGLTHGLLTNAVVEAHSQSSSSYAHESRYAKAGCPGGCPGKKTASVDVNQRGPKLQDPSKVTAKKSPPEQLDPSNGNLGYHLFTEDELLVELSEEGAKQYQALTPEGKTLAIKLASQRCGGTNSCKGQNACKTDTNDCAGMGGCKGQSKCALSDKDLAVKIASKLMAEKRAASLNGK